jgi:hypothetical protein
VSKSGDGNTPALPLLARVRKGWDDFRASLLNFSELPRTRRSQLLFRGQADAGWPLTATLDRARTFESDVLRRDFVNALLDEFRREASIVKSVGDILRENDTLELLARHHGLNSPLLDWTESPYIASYFAYNANRGDVDARVWVLDRAKLSSVGAYPADIDIIDDRMLLRFNRRALQQRSGFVRVNSVRAPLEPLLASSLFAFDLRGGDRRRALNDLDVMNVNGTSLFDDLDGVAGTVRARMF